MNLSRALSFCASLAFFLPLTGTAQTKLLRFPDIHDDRVAFTYGGDLWTAPATGGTATRLTAHPGIEVFAKFSPDGKWIAFTGQYDGDEQVYVMPSTGGVPRQLTFYPARGPLAPRWGYDNQVYGWSNDGRYVIFRSLRDSYTLSINHLYKVPMEGGPAEMFPMPESGAAALSPGGNKLVYSPRSRDFRTEKRYSGGQANVLYVFDLETHEAKRITEGPRAARDPMWIGNAIYFNSDCDGHFNLYSYDLASGKTNQVTENKLWDVRWPSSDRESRIVFELDGELQVMDVKTRKVTPISINVPDDGLARRPVHISAANNIEDFSLSPKGERVLFGARGEVFSAPIEKGPTRNLTHTAGAHEKWPRWSPDGSKVAYISDGSGEEEVYVVAQDGSSAPEQLTQGGKAFRYSPEWSADGSRLAFSDKDGRLFVVRLSDHQCTEITHSERGEIRDYTWSFSSNYLAFSEPDSDFVSALFIWNAADGQLHRVTHDLFGAGNPAWDPEGNYLYYIGNREYAPLISNVEFNFALTRSNGLFALALRKDVKPPFPAESDEVTIKKEGDDKKDDSKDKDKDKEKEKEKDRPKDIAIDFDGLGSRVQRVPVEANNFNGLAVKSGHLLYGVGPSFFYGRDGEQKPSLRIYSLKDRKEATLVEDLGAWALSFDGSKVAVSQGAAYSLYDATMGGATTKKSISTGGLAMDRVPADEWNEVFNEVWRRYRDFFYAPNMHGYDWEAIRKQYSPLLKYVAHRTDLNYVINEMIAELTIQHAYIDGGDQVMPPRPRVALAGARFELDRTANRYRISKIFNGENEEEIYRSPLTEIGVDAKVGDYVLAINGQELTGKDDPFRLLRNAADNPVQLKLNSRPDLTGARTVSYRPITEEANLIYLDWVDRNRHKVSEMSNGRIAYIHVPDMGAAGIREFIKWYFPQLRKEAMIVDVRANGGGNVSRMLIERMRRKLLGEQFARTVKDGLSYPDQVFLGPMVCLLNENSASDGDIFPAMFRASGLGPLIGKRSWGGVVGINDHGPLTDGGRVNVPEFGFANTKGEWIIEGHGVDPDIEVENDAKSVLDGHDPQLERGVAELMKSLAGKKIALPNRPADPIKLQ